jgi:hypothetical protein
MEKFSVIVVSTANATPSTRAGSYRHWVTASRAAFLSIGSPLVILKFFSVPSTAIVALITTAPWTTLCLASRG